MFKKIALSLICVMATLQFGLSGAWAQFAAAASSQPPLQVQPSISPDDPRLFLMIRNAIIALNQANMTGNYSVLRDMGTPNFQMTNSSARLAEVFASLRARKLDVSPIMFFNPKFVSPPALQDGQVLRLTGVFPTTPEQVNFDLAFQLFGDQWMLAAIAVNVAPPGDNTQAFAAPSSEPLEGASKPAEAKPVRIDLSQPTPSPGQPAAPKKATPKKPKHPTQQTAAAQPTAAAPAAAPAQPQQPAQGGTAEEKPAEPAPANSGFGSNWNPFGR